MVAKKRVRESLEIEVDGVLYVGERVVDGTRKLSQHVIYKDLYKSDLHGYPPEHKETLMLGIAKQMMRQLVTGKVMGAKPLSKFK